MVMRYIAKPLLPSNNHHNHEPRDTLSANTGSFIGAKINGYIHELPPPTDPTPSTMINDNPESKSLLSP